MKKGSVPGVVNRRRCTCLYAGGVCLLALLLTLNLLAVALPWRLTKLDVGSGNISRVSDKTLRLVGDLREDVRVYWLCENGETDYSVELFLTRYAEAGDRIQLQIIDTVAQPTFVSKYVGTGSSLSNYSLIVESDRRVTLLDYTDDNVLALFNALSKYYNNIEAVGTKRAKVCADLYNAIVDHRLTTTSKGSVANIDENGVVKFKGFLIEEVPDDLFQTGEVAYVYIDGVGKAFTGINTARTIESEDFDGVALQGAGKAGEFILPDNKKAVCKVLLDSEYGLDNLTVTSAASSTTSGKTKLTVSPTLTSGNSYKYKVADNAVLPAAGQSVKGWTAWNGTDEITAATGKEICVVECDSAYRALKAGVATVTAKA